MSPDESSAGHGARPDDAVGTDRPVDGGTSKVTGLRLASPVMFVTDLGRSVRFLGRAPGHVSVSDESVALLVGPVGVQLYLCSMGRTRSIRWASSRSSTSFGPP
jgi:hypothetical protein